MQTQSCQQFYADLSRRVEEEGTLYNQTALLAMDDVTIITDLFDQGSLAAYSRYNLGKVLHPQDHTYFTAERGGAQGDYRAGMEDKIALVVDSLSRFPHSKRAVITVAPEPLAHHSHDELAKCLREIYFRRDATILHASCVMRAQALSIFPKNIYFLGSLLQEVARRCVPQLEVGTLFYFAVCVVADRR